MHLSKYVEGDLKKVVVAIAAGHPFCIVTDEGYLYTWGSNEYGQLGHTSRSTKQIWDSQQWH